MKIIHTADWRLGNTLYGYDRGGEFCHFLSWLGEVVREECPDALLVSGGVFDGECPDADAERLLYDFLNQVIAWQPQMQIVIIQGGCDSVRRLEAPANLLQGVKVCSRVCRNEKGTIDWSKMMVELPSDGLPSGDVEAVVMTLPDLQWNDCRDGEKKSGALQRMAEGLSKYALNRYGKDVVLILMTYGMIQALPAVVSYAALGGERKSQNLNGNGKARYAGGVVPLDFEEKDYPFGVNVVTIENGVSAVTRKDYEPLRKMIIVPENGEVSCEDALRILKQFPKEKRNSDTDSWDFMEIRLSQVPESFEKAQALVAAAKERCIRLCRIYGPKKSSEDNQSAINPARLAHNAYERLFSEEMPDEVSALFAGVKRRVENKNEER